MLRETQTSASVNYTVAAPQVNLVILNLAPLLVKQEHPADLHRNRGHT